MTKPARGVRTTEMSARRWGRVRGVGALVVAGAILAASGGAAALASVQPGAEAQAQTITLAPKFHAGMSLAFRVTYEAKLSMPSADGDDGEEQVDRVVRQGSLIRVNVVKVDENTGAATLKVEIPSIVTTHTSLGETTSGAWSEARAGEAPPEPLPEDAAAVEAVTRALGEATLTVELARDGSITSLTGLENAAAVAEQFAFRRDGERTMGYFAPAVIQRNLEHLWRVDEASDGKAMLGRRVGERWTLDYDYALPTGGVRVDESYRLARTSDRMSELNGMIRTSIVEPEGDPDPATPKVEIVKQNVVFTTTWMNTPGVVAERAERGEVITQATVAGSAGEGEEGAAEPIVVRVRLLSSIDVELEAMKGGQ